MLPHDLPLTLRNSLTKTESADVTKSDHWLSGGIIQTMQSTPRRFAQTGTQQQVQRLSLLRTLMTKKEESVWGSLMGFRTNGGKRQGGAEFVRVIEKAMKKTAEISCVLKKSCPCRERGLGRKKGDKLFPQNILQQLGVGSKTKWASTVTSPNLVTIGKTWRAVEIRSFSFVGDTEVSSAVPTVRKSARDLPKDRTSSKEEIG